MSAVRRKDHDIIADDKLRAVWASRYKCMVRRCTNERDAAYPNYGGRGIHVYQPWVEDRRAFFHYVVTLPHWDEPGLDFDRSNNDLGYAPGNLRLVPRVVNANNKRTNRIVEYRGRHYTVAQFWREFCPTWRSHSAVTYHLDLGRTPESIVAMHGDDGGSV